PNDSYSHSPLRSPNDSYSHSPLGIRKDHPATPAPATTVVVKKAKTTPGGTRGRPRASDFDEFTKNIIEDANVGYRAYISTNNPYPLSDNEQRDVSSGAWVAACRVRKVEVEFDDDMFRLISARGSQTCGQLKTICRALTEAQYGIASEKGKRANREKVEAMFERTSFDPTKRTGMYLHPIIQSSINRMWFKSKTDKGVIRPEYSDRENGIPLVTIAFIECCLEEWQSGEYHDVTFLVTAYQTKYKAHLAALREFDVKTKEHNIVPRLRKHLLRNARKHAKVDTTVTTVQLGDEDFAASQNEWNNMVFSDEE
ncbi:hypothetical protein C0991_006603, partial [Blastosporella zonata]